MSSIATNPGIDGKSARPLNQITAEGSPRCTSMSTSVSSRYIHSLEAWPALETLPVLRLVAYLTCSCPAIVNFSTRSYYSFVLPIAHELSAIAGFVTDYHARRNQS